MAAGGMWWEVRLVEVGAAAGRPGRNRTGEGARGRVVVVAAAALEPGRAGSGKQTPHLPSFLPSSLPHLHSSFCPGAADAIDLPGKPRSGLPLITGDLCLAARLRIGLPSLCCTRIRPLQAPAAGVVPHRAAAAPSRSLCTSLFCNVFSEPGLRVEYTKMEGPF